MGRMAQMTDKAQAILIVGDWVIDEYWFLVRHQSDISSHTGFTHYRSANRTEKILADLCGAGHVARVIYSLLDEVEGQYIFFGLGHWNKRDTKLITHLVHVRGKSESVTSIAPYSQARRCCPKDKGIDLFTLKPNGPTIRVIRQYHQESSEWKQINRIDWEPRYRQDAEINKTYWHALESKLPLKDSVRAIVIHDLTKGVVNNDLVADLLKRYPKAHWYVRSKARDLSSKDKVPPWLKSVEKRLKLLLIGPEVAGLINPWASWLVQGKVTFQALDAIDNLPGKNVVLLTEQHEVIARLERLTKSTPKPIFIKQCITGMSGVIPTQFTQFNWPSALFASFIRAMIANQDNMDREEIIKALKSADNFSGIDPSEGIEIREKEIREPYVTEPIEWQMVVDEWYDAWKKLGIIKKKSGKGNKVIEEQHLEVWRGQTQLPGYVTCIKKKQEIINKIGRNLRAFKRNRMRSLSIMLTADPGAGKTSLARSLSEIFEFEFIPFNITMMLHRDDLLDLFDTVANLQAKKTNQILVFVDEINAELDRSHVYGAFLAPLEEGVYVRGGKSFSLKPCAWIFAGTKMPNREVAEKLSDFESRMTMIENIDYESLSREMGDEHKSQLDAEARLEQVYIGASMIRNYFSDVKYVSREILQLFHDLKPIETPARQILKLVTSLQNVQYGTITRDNFPDAESIKIWNNDRTLVKLVF